jgi:hypothetical protein
MTSPPGGYCASGPHLEDIPADGALGPGRGPGSSGHGGRVVGSVGGEELPDLQPVRAVGVII